MTVLLSLLFFLLPSQHTDWIKHESINGTFSILLPGEPREKDQNITTEMGDISYHTIYYKNDSIGESPLYLISYCDYPEGGMHSDSLELIEEFYEASIEEATYSLGGELLYSDIIHYKNYPGRIWRIDYEEEHSVKTKSFLINNRYYSLQVFYIKGHVKKKDINIFFDSFKLLVD